MNRDAETVPARHETPDVAELRRLAEAATPGPWDCYRPHPNYRAYAVDRVMPGGHLGEDVATTGDVCAEENGAYIAAANPAAVLGLLDRLAHMREARDNARAERDALRTWQERVAVAAGIGEEVEGRGVYLEANPDAAAEHVAGLLAVADTHIECPVYCGGCGEPLADALCDHCSGSGCGPGTALGAYEECGWCAGAGKVHPGCADLSYADLVAERDALAAKVERVRALPAKHPAGGWYMTSMRDVLAALDEEPQP